MKDLGMDGLFWNGKSTKKPKINTFFLFRVCCEQFNVKRRE